MQSWIVAGGYVFLLAAALLGPYVFTGPEPMTTEDIDAIYNRLDQRLDVATFVPGTPREEVVDNAFDGMNRLLGDADRSSLETRTTVGLYTGPDNGGNPVVGRKVWLVVVDNLPIVFPSGPYMSPENRVDRSDQRRKNQMVAFFDADTGKEIWGAIAGRWVEK